ACRALGVPVVGGNVSLYNEGAEGPIYPTPVVGMVGELPDPARAGRSGFAREGDVVALAGPFAPVLEAGELAKLRGVALPVALPEVDVEAARKTQAAVRDAVRAGDLCSAHDIAEGGLLVAVAESCLAGAIGARLAGRPLAALATALTPRGRAGRAASRVQDGVPEPLAAALFGEAPGTGFVVAGPQEALDRLGARTPVVELGTVGGEVLAVGDDLAVGLDELRAAHAALGPLFP
ncbi:MAG TPA: AIR synthase-related protein, partial [Solirubrobacteraceae bacterium]|nr:AIR synthase-related protein [Solirubrobacteraceae bacterium]